MKQKYKVALSVIFLAAIAVITGWYMQRYPIPVLQPHGATSDREKALIVFATSLSLAIVIPVFSLLGYFGWKYREGNKKAKYTPSLGGSKGAELIWWIVPSVLITIISILTWQTSYALDPFKSVEPSKQSLHIQVVALDWKWLFIYPDQHVASVNELTLPENTPVDFEITSDSVMNSFWIPSLSGQMYAMPGMTTHLNVLANKLGTYNGSAANISGKGFADMNFAVHVTGSSVFSQWAKAMRTGTAQLNMSTYAQLAKPSSIPAGELHRYGSVDTNLYSSIIMKYMMPMGSDNNAMNGKMQ